MPVEFLTDEQAGAYGSFQEVPTQPELERFFFLDTDDLDLVALRRSDGHRLGMALQICTVRYIGLFLQDPLEVPWPVVEYLAEQLAINDPSCVKQYVERAKTAYEHSCEIRRRLGYHEFEDPQRSRKFRTFLYGRAWTHPEGPVALFNHAVAWLRRSRVLFLSLGAELPRQRLENVDHAPPSAACRALPPRPSPHSTPQADARAATADGAAPTDAGSGREVARCATTHRCPVDNRSAGTGGTQLR
ncbi:MAG: DUF4158 domain-containing protein [Pseudonocardiaceae bacterium]